MPAPALKAQWATLPDAPESPRLDDIYFLTPSIGWAISPDYSYYYSFNPTKYGQVSYTNDGGNTWQARTDSVQTFFRCVGFADSLNGWIGNLGGNLTPDTVPLYYTNDGGFTLYPVTNIPNPKPRGICGISVVNDTVTYAYGRYYGPPVLLKTTDKGQTWNSIDMSPYASGLVDGYFTHPDTGFIIGGYGSPQQAIVLYTNDGGTTWSQKYLSAISNKIGWKIMFPSRNIGYVAVQKLSAVGTNILLKTTNGGMSWTELPFSNSNYNIEGIGFINDSIGWIGGDYSNSTCYITLDGGATWSADNSWGESNQYNQFGNGLAINRFRRFGDTLMYASGNTVYKYTKPAAGVNQIIDGTRAHAYPVPAKDRLILTFGLSNTPGTIRIYDAVGKQMMSVKEVLHSEKFIDTSAYRNGTYFYEIITETGSRIAGQFIVLRD